MFQPDLLEAPPAAADAVGGTGGGSGVGSMGPGSSVEADGRPLTLEAVVAEARRSLAACRGERLDARQATAVVRWANELVRVGEALRLVGLGRVEETKAWQAADGDDSGARNARTWAANTLGVEAGEAGRLLEAAAAVRDHREVEELVRSGEVAPTVVAEVAKTVAAKPDRAGEICDEARRAENPRDAKDRLRRVRQEGESEADRHARHHKERSLRIGTDDEGRFVARLQGPASDRAEFEALLAPFTDQQFQQAKSEGRFEPQGAYAYDALLTMARAAAEPGSADLPPGFRRGGADAKVIIRIDETALQRGWVAPGETCTLNGDPVDVKTAADAVAKGAFVTAVTTQVVEKGPHQGEERVIRVTHLGRAPTVVDELRATLLPDEHPIRRALTAEEPIAQLVHTGRTPNAKQRTALQWMHPTCAVPGCPHRHGLQMDHHKPWCLSKVTVLNDLQALCPAHHRDKTTREATDRTNRRRTDLAQDRQQLTGGATANGP